MPKNRPATSGYARLAQEEEEEDVFDDSDQDDVSRGYHALPTEGTVYAPIQPQRRQERMNAADQASITSQRSTTSPRPRRRNSGVDIKAINARLERWADEIASKFKRRKWKDTGQEDEQLEIQHSVFQAPEWIKPATAEELNTVYADPPDSRISDAEFEDIVESVRVAIELGTHPKLISQGSSGSYFARNADGKVVGVFKPKDEEPYASRNPKWTKWIHRNLFPFFFGRACLIPNLSYISEAAAYTLDLQLRANLVPYTGVVGLSSKSFFYDFWDRRAYYRKKKPLPEKLGSFQVFLKGYKDATQFLKKHPWPDQHSSGSRPDHVATKKRKRRWAEDCRPGGPQSDGEEEEDIEEASAEETRRRRVFWTEPLQQSFREQLEKLVILDYIMRNTDRGLDNWMIRIDQKEQKVSIVAEPPKTQSVDGKDSNLMPNGHPASGDEQYRRREQMTTTSRAATPMPHELDRCVKIGAIDNSLSWPWKHPDAWRSYPFGWLFLPVSLIGQPFSEATRSHFLPLLTSKAWWSETQLALRRCFMQDADFQEKMFARQMAVMKGQAWNVVETLKTPDHGPLELTRRARVCVWDDLVDVPVAVPLRSPMENARRNKRRKEEQEEIDLSAARASAPQPHHDILDLGQSRRDFAPGGQFNMSRQSSQMDIRPSTDSNGGPLSPDSVKMMADSDPAREGTPPGYFTSRPENRSRMSYEDARRSAGNKSSWRNQRRFSLSFRRASSPFFEDDEGDLGYAAAEDRENSLKRVIVERLEPVKSKKPFFTWC